MDTSIRVYDLDTLQPTAQLFHGDVVGTLEISSDGETLATGSNDQTVRVWNATTFEAQNVLQGHRHSVRHLAFLNGGPQNILCSAGKDTFVRVSLFPHVNHLNASTLGLNININIVLVG